MSLLLISLISRKQWGLGRDIEGAVNPQSKLPVFQVCLTARCLTLTGAGDECSLWQPVELTDSWESQLPAVKVSIFKAHQLQWEDSRTVHMPALTVKQEKFLLSMYCIATAPTQTQTFAVVTPLQNHICRTRECN